MNDTKSYPVEETEVGLIRRAEGKEETARETARNFYEMGLSIENIARGIGCTEDTVKNWLGLYNERFAEVPGGAVAS